MSISRILAPPREPQRLRLVELIVAAGQPYYQWLGHEDLWRTFLVQSVGHSSSEHSYNHSMVTESRSDGIEALAVLVPAGELNVCRQRDGMRYLSSVPRASRKSFLETLMRVRGVLPPVPDDCAYLSKIAVDSASRDSGRGAQLLDFVMTEASVLGQRIALHVSSNNSRALHLYEKVGFQHLATGAEVDGAHYFLLQGPK